ncbi:TolC family protein [Dyella sp.]|uniref:TolC family protein n=1 Tax=Dyella sp. TaxID=1869338 RepID=UPI002ED532EE
MSRVPAEHRTHRWRTLAVALVLYGGVGQVHAQLDDTRSTVSTAKLIGEHRIYSLQDLIGVALESNPSYQEAQEQALQAHLETSLVRAQYAPHVNIKALAGNEHTPLAITRNVSPRGYIVSTSREIIPSLQLKWLLFDFGRKKGQVEAATQLALAADSGLMGAQEKLVFDVSRAYFDVMSAQGKMRAAEKGLHAAQLMEEAVNGQKQHGRTTVVQVAQAHRQTAAAQVALTRASGDAQTAFAMLVATVGLPAESQFQLSSPSSASMEAAKNATLAALIDTALDNRPDILAAQSKVAAAAAKVAATKADYHPTVSIQAQVFQNIGKTSSDNSPFSSVNLTGNSIFVAFELPLFDGGARATKVSLASSERTQAEDALAETKNLAVQQVVQSYNDLKTSLDNRKQAVDYTQAAKIAYQASLESYRHGMASVTDLTNDEAALAQAEASQEDANADVMIAQAALALATGQHTMEP